MVRVPGLAQSKMIKVYTKYDTVPEKMYAPDIHTDRVKAVEIYQNNQLAGYIIGFKECKIKNVTEGLEDVKIIEYED